MEAAHTYTINSIHPWRMLLFGVIACLIPIVLFMMSWNWWNPQFTDQYPYFFDLLIIPVLVLSAALTYLGFRMSAVGILITLDSKGFNIQKNTHFPFIPKASVYKPWEEIIAYQYLEDNKGKILKIKLNDKSQITIAQAFVLGRSGDFDRFYASFANYYKPYEITSDTFE